MATTANDLGISLGIATVGSIGVAAYRSDISDKLPSGLSTEVGTAAKDSLDGAVFVVGQLPADAGAAVLTAARTAFTSGLNTAAVVAAAVTAIAAILAVTRLHHVPPTGSVPTEPQTDVEQKTSLQSTPE